MGKGMNAFTASMNLVIERKQKVRAKTSGRVILGKQSEILKQGLASKPESGLNPRKLAWFYTHRTHWF